jgi:exopolysaccharide production protein ExoY
MIRFNSLDFHLEGSAVPPRSTQLSCKRCMDIIGSLVLIFVFAPLMLGICIVIRSLDGGPALFRQTRVGFGGRQFTCLKFRSMVLDAQLALREFLAANPGAREEWEATQKLTDDPRVTRFGRFLRRSSLDELPQLFNVLVGDMSLVGPRPIVQLETDRYEDKLHIYTSMRPGLTGLWQVSGRSDCSYQERVALDVEYVSTWRLANDLVIILQTIPAVLAQRGSR